MSASPLVRLQRDIDAIAHRAAPPAPLTAVAVAQASGLAPDEWQRTVLESDARQLILLCARQSGKSTISAVLATHAALYQAPSLVLCLSPSQRQSTELFRKCLDIYRALGEPVAAIVQTRLELELANGSRLVALPSGEAKIRGFSGVDLLLCDEASRIPEALYQSARPMLSISGGRLVLLSTPFGKRGFFHHEWTEGGASWERTKITAHDCPRISADWLVQERATIGQWWFSQEYLCSFEEAEDQLFHDHDIDAAFSDTIAPLWAPEGLQP
ncbi:MAG: hypothetical protein H0V24_04745 [Chloroflexia bacterium]|nr:hypothetical protein [Chloroflexia bacterium]